VAWLEVERPPEYSVEKDAWGNHFVWETTGTTHKATVRIISRGRDGIIGGSDADDMTMCIHYVNGRETGMELLGLPN
jgi:hypothetical protein